MFVFIFMITDSAMFLMLRGSVKREVSNAILRSARDLQQCLWPTIAKDHPDDGVKPQHDGSHVDANSRQAPVAVDTYYITPNKCTECQGFHEEPQCAAVCPVDCCIPDEMYRETVDELMAKKEKLHI